MIIQILPLKQKEKEGKWGHVYFNSAFKSKRKRERRWMKEVLKCSGAPGWLTRRSNLKDKKGKYRWFSLPCDPYTIVSCCLVLCILYFQMFSPYRIMSPLDRFQSHEMFCYYSAYYLHFTLLSFSWSFIVPVPC